MIIFYFHNKNLTKEQYYRIIDMRDALNSVVDFSD
nr:MAG TPA: 8.2 KDa protein [Caudoviricetes sp.]